MKTLITGGAGFIGSHLVDLLLKNGHEIIVVDSFSYGNKDNLSDNKNNKNLKIVDADITDIQSIKPYFQDIGWVFHLAGLGGIKQSIEKPLEYFHFNVGGTINALEAAREAGVRKFIYANSASCYGIQKSFPTSEKAEISLNNPYTMTKHWGESCCLEWGRIYQLPVISLRLFKVYGPRRILPAHDKDIFGNFLEQKINGQPLKITGDGNQTRDFVYVTDVAAAFLAAAESPSQDEVFNIGSGKTHSINYLTGLLQAPAEYFPHQKDELDCTQADISKARKQLNWRPKIPLEEGVQYLLDYAIPQKTLNV